MIDHFAIFSKTGTVLWSKTLCKLSGDPIDTLINRVLMEDRSGEKKFINDAYQMQWAFENKLDLVFVVVYQKILQLLYIEELLELVKKDFIALFPQQIAKKDPVTYDEQFLKILKSTELKFAQKQTRNAPRAFNGSRKSKGVVSTASSKTPATSSSRPKTSDEESNDGNDSPSSEGKMKDKLEELENEVALRSQVRKMRTGPGRKALKSKKSTGGEEKKKGKQMTKWENSKLSKKEISELDRSKQLTVDEEEAQLREKREAYIGEAEESESEEFSDTDDESAMSSGAESDSKESAWSFSNTRIGNFFTTVSGNKILTREDLEPVVAPMHNLLISKNVASEVADELCESVLTTLVGQRLESFTRVSTVVRKALEAALLRILTPKKSTDVLREILEAKAAGRAYSIVFVGVNGVGKSTSLSKVCYYLKSKGVKVMIAACDTFRSGAVEQLNQHAKVLDVPLFQKGYAKDPAAVAKEAVKYGTENGFDCVLIDTAGRMQNNEPLMRALAKLVSINEPDLVLFVGEALVGNDGIDQLSMFDRALADYSDRREPHRIDGIVITKFDTIDDKVGAAVSMVYKTGQPIMFVGTGQKYTHLKKLNRTMWILDVVSASSNAVENTFYLVAGEWSIGRKKCHFNFQSDSSISRTHALLRVGTLPLEQLKDTMSRPSLVLVDQNSRFGSFVNQEQCFTERELKNGDHITFGAKRTVLRVRYQVFILVASRIQRANRTRVNETCQRIGMHLIASESKDATHCIMDPGKIVATVKVLWALVYNQPVVCTPWIYAILGRKSLSEPLPRCEEYLPADEQMPSMASNYLPNPMRKTLYHRHVVVFLTPQSMEEIIAEMAGIVIAAYKDASEHDDLLLRDIEQHASSRHVLVVEPIQGTGFSSAAASSDGREVQGGGAHGHTAVERRVSLFRSIGATFTTIQELAASVVFVKAPATSSEYSFSNSLAGHNSSSVQICSFPEHLSLRAPPAEPESDDAGEETSSHVKEESTRTPMPEVIEPRSVSAAAPRLNERAADLRSGKLKPHSLPEDPIQVKEELVQPVVPTVKEEVPIMEDLENPEPVYDNPSQQHAVEYSQSFAATNVLSLEPFTKRESDHEDGLHAASGWMSTLSGMPRRVDDCKDDDEPEHQPVVVRCNLIMKRPAAVHNPQRSGSGVNFKRFKKGNGYAARSKTWLFPQQMVVSVTVDNADRVALEENLGVLEEQERIADELFAMAENRNSRRRF